MRVRGDLGSNVESISICQGTSSAFMCNVVRIGMLVSAKLKSYRNREAYNDYFDLRFLCKSPVFGRDIQRASLAANDDEKEYFLKAVRKQHPGDEARIRE